MAKRGCGCSLATTCGSRRLTLDPLSALKRLGICCLLNARNILTYQRRPRPASRACDETRKCPVILQALAFVWANIRPAPKHMLARQEHAQRCANRPSNATPFRHVSNLPDMSTHVCPRIVVRARVCGGLRQTSYE